MWARLAYGCLLLWFWSSPGVRAAAPGSAQVRVAVDQKSQAGSSLERSEFTVWVGWEDMDAMPPGETSLVGWIEQLDTSVVSPVRRDYNASGGCRALGIRIAKSALNELLLDQVIQRPPTQVWLCGFEGEPPHQWVPCLDGMSYSLDHSQLCPQPGTNTPTIDVRMFATEPLERPPPSSGSFLSAGNSRSSDVEDKPVAWVELEAEANAWARAIPLLAEILEPVIDEVMEPVVNPVVNMIAPALGEDFQEMFQQEMGQQVPGDVAEMLAATLSTNLTNVVADALASRLTQTLAAGLTRTLGPSLLRHLTTSVTEGAVDQIEDIMEDSFSDRVVARVADRTRERALPLLVRVLTVSVSQSVVPAVVASVASEPSGSVPRSARWGPLREEWCQMCARPAGDAAASAPPRSLCGWCSARPEDEEAAAPPPSMMHVWAGHWYAAWYSSAMSHYFAAAAVALRDAQQDTREAKEAKEAKDRLDRLRTVARGAPRD